MPEDDPDLNEFEAINTDAYLTTRGFRRWGAPLAAIALDPAGDGEDRAALTVTDREVWVRGEPWDDDVQVLVRYVWRGGLLYPNQTPATYVKSSVISAANQLRTSMDRGKLVGFTVAVECNGVGWALASDLKQKMPGLVVPVMTTGGKKPSVSSGGNPTMPRAPALDFWRVLMEESRWKVDKHAPMRDALKREMDAFVWRGGKPQAAAGKHDDLLMSSVVGTWALGNMVPLDLQFSTQPRRQRLARR